MKPKSLTSVRDFLSQKPVGKPVSSVPPYDTYPSSKAGFLTLAIGDEFIALPLVSLGKASQLGNGTMLYLEFGPQNVAIKGSNLDGLFEDILLGRVRSIRPGKHPSCTVEEIRVVKAPGL